MKKYGDRIAKPKAKGVENFTPEKAKEDLNKFEKDLTEFKPVKFLLKDK
jgi:hypothetical protein